MSFHWYRIALYVPNPGKIFARFTLFTSKPLTLLKKVLWGRGVDGVPVDTRVTATGARKATSVYIYKISHVFIEKEKATNLFLIIRRKLMARGVSVMRAVVVMRGTKGTMKFFKLLKVV